MGRGALIIFLYIATDVQQRSALLTMCMPESGLTCYHLFFISVYISVYGLLCLDPRPTS